ncbi:UDP-N-acetylglucosamine 2-epimerase [Candidatus Pelagibacter sp.]|jgi:UDP-hydrolysing UDP-N-acetyl-D-glucosamine 2-epimerase|nr:UDP-N-acetylglucosamine 2-epimerase [Candidatus Pelagibacter sp.]
MKYIKKICIFTGNRAEYGLLRPLIIKINKQKNFLTSVLISGAHLQNEFGKTILEIKKDKIKNYKLVNINGNFKKDDNFNSMIIGNAIMKISKELNKFKPDIFVVYADRFEGFAAMIASTQMNIPTIHVEGGDITEGGALDDNVRHAMTKLAHFHLTTNYEATKRIIAMGEEKWRVKTIGYPTVDLIKQKNYATESELKKKFNLKYDDKIVIFTQHSVTTEYEDSLNQLKKSLKALEKVSKEGIKIIITYPNNDIGSDLILKSLKNKKYKNNNNISIYKSIGRYFYHGILALGKNNKFKVCCVGNSSSGIKETPIFNCPTVNIGSRQLGRLRSENIIDVDYNDKKIYLAIRKAFDDKKFIKQCLKCSNPYGIGNSAVKMINFLNKIHYSKSKILKKKMTLDSKKLNKINI